MPTDRVDRYSICQAVVRAQDFGIDLAWAAAAGASGVSLGAMDVEEYGIERTKALLSREGLAVSTVERWGGSPLDGEPPELQVQAVTGAIELCASLGARGLLVTTGPIEPLGIGPAEADRRCKAWFELMAPIAAAHGVRLALEPVHPLLRWASYVHSLRHAADLTGGSPGTGVLLDVGHLWWDHNLFDDVSALVDQIVSVQVDDVPVEALREFHYARVQLGDGCIPLRELIGAIEEAGFRGWYENEIGMRMRREDRIEFFRTSGQRLTAMLASP
jgi:sugar phosphate isomerase/epimerase